MNVTRCSSIMPTRYVSFGKRKEPKILTPQERQQLELEQEQEEYRTLRRVIGPAVWAAMLYLATIAEFMRCEGWLPLGPCNPKNTPTKIQKFENKQISLPALNEEAEDEIIDEDTDYDTSIQELDNPSEEMIQDETESIMED